MNDSGRAQHDLDPEDFRHTGLRLRWGHEHSPDAFEVFALAVGGIGDHARVVNPKP